MKAIKFLTTLVMVTFLFTACDKDKTEYIYEGDDFLYIEETNYSVKENQGTLTIDLLLTSPAESSFNVEIELTDDEAVEGVDYNYAGETTLTFETGEYTKSIDIEIIDNIILNPAKTFTVGIVSATADYIIGVPGPDQKHSLSEVLINDDDCSLDLNVFNGEVEGYETCIWWIDSPYDYKIESIEELEEDKIIVTIAGLFGVQFYVSYWWYSSKVALEAPVEVILDMTDRINPTFSIPAGQICMKNIDDAWFDPDRNIYIEEVVDAPLEIDVCNKSFTIHYTPLHAKLSWEVGVIHTVSFDFE